MRPVPPTWSPAALCCLLVTVRVLLGVPVTYPRYLHFDLYLLDVRTTTTWNLNGLKRPNDSRFIMSKPLRRKARLGDASYSS